MILLALLVSFPMVAGGKGRTEESGESHVAGVVGLTGQNRLAKVSSYSCFFIFFWQNEHTIYSLEVLELGDIILDM